MSNYHLPLRITQKSEHLVYYTYFYQLLKVKKEICLLPTECIYCFVILSD